MNILKIRYKSTNCYFIDTGKGILAFDAGWPGTYREYKDLIKKEGYSIKDIKWLIVSHFHMDHAGLAGQLADNGVQFIIFENQFYGIREMENLIERKELSYHKIDMKKVIGIELSVSRTWLNSIGLDGEVIQTNGHGNQCVTLLLDSGEAFIGDLAPEHMVGEEDHLSKNNWKDLRFKGAKNIRPAHASEYKLIPSSTETDKYQI